MTLHDVGQRLLDYYPVFMETEPRWLHRTFSGLSLAACQDLAQEAYLAVGHKAAEGELATETNVRAYLRRAARNLAVDWCRAQQRGRRRLVLMDGEALEAVAERWALADAGQAVLEELVIPAIEEMPGSLRRQVVDLQSQGLSDMEIATVLGISIYRLSNLRNKAITDLRVSLAGHIREASQEATARQEGQVRDVSRYDDHRGRAAGRPEPVVPTQLAQLLTQLAGPPDPWDRPRGDFGPLTQHYALTLEERAHANSLYRLGSKALGRGELSPATEWLGAAAEAGHPGALFRMAALAARAGSEEAREDVRYLVAEAARHGHGDAHILLEATTSAQTLAHLTPADIEDPQFIDEVRESLGLPLLPQEAGAGADEPPTRDGSQGTPASGTDRLVLVPAPRLNFAARPRWLHRRPSRAVAEGHAAERPQSTSLSGAAHHGDGLLFPLAPEHPGVSPTAPAGNTGGRDAWWCADALRPAVLTDMARSTPAQADTPGQWKAAIRALDILYLVDAADGITTRDLTGRSGLPHAAVARLVDWLRGQQLICTVAGAHLPGPLMKMTHHPQQRTQLLQQTLAGLRDQLGAAVYVSTYTPLDRAHHHQPPRPVRSTRRTRTLRRPIRPAGVLARGGLARPSPSASPGMPHASPYRCRRDNATDSCPPPTSSANAPQDSSWPSSSPTKPQPSTDHPTPPLRKKLPNSPSPIQPAPYPRYTPPHTEHPPPTPTPPTRAGDTGPLPNPTPTTWEIHLQKARLQHHLCREEHLTWCRARPQAGPPRPADHAPGARLGHPRAPLRVGEQRAERVLRADRGDVTGEGNGGASVLKVLGVVRLLIPR
ncbi:hypothetical protein HEK616_82960 (plasmid) [Streptomyces nigrescens]|uniref:RNA polymerase sigma-70 region 2 domain-containing protein n=1 Tax=Streptomyces nigrescens TaxID=1920 RepID=A0ABM8A828_STRNI|nr:hypothetical protein HEK616_82960 [Streptomyces nigrescens]